MRICIHKATKRIIEMQSHATEGTLLGNAVNSGYDPSEVEERAVTASEYAAAKAEDPDAIAVLAAQAAREAAQAAKEQAYIDNLPSRAAMLAAIDKVTTDVQTATTLAMVKPAILALIAIVRKMGQVVYWLAKNTAE